MTPKQTLALPLVLAFMLAGCSEGTIAPTRMKTVPLPIGTQSQAFVEANLQAESLMHLADEMLLRSTGRGAAAGTVIGCGLGLISSSSAKRCIAGAVAGGVAGGVIGHEAGKAKLRQHMGKISADDMATSLRETSDKLKEINRSLPKLLAQQDAELKALHQAKASGEISQLDFASSVEHIRAHRAALAAALTDSASKANQSAQNLGAASANGQPGLMWHIDKAMRLEEEATSARSQLKLF